MTTFTRKLGTNDGIRKAFVEDFEMMEAEVAKVERHNRELHETNERLLQENNILHEQLTDTKRERDRLQAYSVALTTRLDTIVDIVQAAKREAVAQATRTRPSTEAIAEEAKPIEEGDDQVRDILRRVGAGEGVASITRVPKVAMGG
jgi:peptidoglycan hydrolase CwlO-like protein